MILEFFGWPATLWDETPADYIVGARCSAGCHAATVWVMQSEVLETPWRHYEANLRASFARLHPESAA